MNKLLIGVVLIIAVFVGIVVMPVDDATDPFTFTTLDQLAPNIREWFQKDGEHVRINGFNMFVKRVNCKKDDKRIPVILVHGFPSSSYEFHKVTDGLCEAVGPVLLLDHVGFGYSDKPDNKLAHQQGTTNTLFSHSIIDHAEQLILLLEKLNIKSAHFISHDVGNSVMNEIVGRLHRKTLPSRFLAAGFFKSWVITNGGAVYRESSPRIGQVLLSLPGIGPVFSRIMERLDARNRFLSFQLRGIWGNAPQSERDQDINEMISIIHFSAGHKKLHDTISYIRDRQIYESRWHPALVDLPKLVGKCALVWGDSDAVAPMGITRALQKMQSNKCDLKVIEGAGHFLQLERPTEWVNNMKKILV